MILGAIVGGFTCAFYARKVAPSVVRSLVIALASGMTVYFFVDTYLMPLVRRT